MRRLAIFTFSVFFLVSAAPKRAAAQETEATTSVPTAAATASDAPKAAAKKQDQSTPAPAAPNSPDAQTPPAPPAAGPDLNTGKTVQLFRDTHRATIEFPGVSPELVVGAEVTLTAPSGVACEGRIATVTGKRAKAEFEKCDAFAEFTTTAIASLSPPVPAPTVAPAIANESTATVAPEELANTDEPTHQKARDKSLRERMRVSVRALFDTGSTLHFDNAKVTTGVVTYTGTVDYRMDQSAGIAAEITVSEPNQWGANIGASIETPRRLDRVDVVIPSLGTYSSFNVAGDPSLSLVTLYGNALYRWHTVYVPLGLNISIPWIDNAPAVLSSPGGRIGVQGGVGVFVSDEVAAELMLRSVTIASTPTWSYGSYVDLGYGSISSLQLGLKYFF